ncbi:nucleotide-binding protein [Thermophagus sp. OGC60D27]|uniref:nucleotide-binding protein n=1 Tax=Thermophagus sp. OGC60D27 TaxID=3458415 RepID=UPI0040381DC1
MPFKIAVASGKGGTGKTTVSVNLQYFISRYLTDEVLLVDCDVEEPNDRIFFPQHKIVSDLEVSQSIPEIDLEKCVYCRRCADYCEFNAIVVIPPARFAEINASLCHSCGACSAACREGTIMEKPHPLGTITTIDTGIGKGVVEGALKVGSAMQTLMIKELKKYVSGNRTGSENSEEIILFDAPPGTSCPVVETVADVDYVILVTEPTPFGLNDLMLMVELLVEIEKPFGVVVNKAGLGNSEIYSFLREQEVDLLGEIPFDKDYAGRYAEGKLLQNVDDRWGCCYSGIVKSLERRFQQYEGINYFKW